MRTRVSDYRASRIGSIPRAIDFIRESRRRFGLASIDAINIFKKMFALARRVKPDMSLDDFYVVAESVLARCVTNGRVDVSLCTSMFHDEISREEEKVHETILEHYDKVKRQLLNQVHDVRKLILSLRNQNLEDRILEEYIESLQREVKIWRGIREKTSSVDFSELIKSTRRM